MKQSILIGTFPMSLGIIPVLIPKLRGFIPEGITRFSHIAIFFMDNRLERK